MAFGSNNASLLGALKYRFSFGCPKEPLFFLGLSNLAALGSNTFSLFWVPKNTAFLLKEKRCFWAPKRKAVFDPRALKLLRPQKKSGNTASLLDAQEYRFSFMCPKILLFISGLSSLGAVLLAQACRNYVDSQRCLRQVEQLRCCDDNDILSKTM